jgi:hypothetical protein
MGLQGYPEHGFLEGHGGWGGHRPVQGQIAGRFSSLTRG